MEKFLEDLITETKQNIKFILANKISNKELQEDLYQQIMLTLSQNKNTVENDSNPKDWIYTITQNKIKDFYKKKKDVLVEQFLLEETRSFYDPFDKIFSKEKDTFTKKCLYFFIEHLEKGKWILKDYLAGYKYENLSLKYQIAPETARKQVSRARQKIKDEIIFCCGSEEKKQKITSLSSKNKRKVTMMTNCSTTCHHRCATFLN